MRLFDGHHGIDGYSLIDYLKVETFFTISGGYLAKKHEIGLEIGLIDFNQG
jgi:hypothetical protein